MINLLSPRSSGGACLRSPVISLLLIATLAALSLATGCVSVKERGDRAFAAQEYNRALDHYEQEMEQGSRDAELYFKAAQSAVRVGDFSLAERYYSRSLRYGGGEEVKRSLAEFYIATSNFTKAVRVLQQLLETTENPQSMFNNLGTALMYAGAPLDAESYLLVAQQMNPQDPVPYINLAVLYDKYLHQPRMSLGFFRCFLEIGKGSSNRRNIEARIRALEMQYGKTLPERYQVVCGKPYQPPGPPSKAELRAELGLDGEQQKAKEPREKEPREKEQDTDGADEQPVKIYRQVEERPEQPGDSEAPGADTPSTAKKLALAEQAFSQQNHARVVKYLEEVPASALDARAMSLYGRSLAELDEHQRAQRWLAAAVEADPDAENVSALLGVYRELNDADRIAELCERFAGDEKLEDVLEECPE